MKYPDLDRVIETCFALDNADDGQGIIFYSKTDIKSAFRILPLSSSCYQWLIMKATNPVDEKTWFFVEKNLPFGASISCSHFQRFSNALRHIFEYKSGKRMVVTNYLDDFLFVAKSPEDCNNLVRLFLCLCDEIGVPIATEKTKHAASQMVFLGILLDGAQRIMSIPLEKVQKTTNLLNVFLDKKKATVKELQSLSGLLNFLGRAIFPGRAFTRHMYSKFSESLSGKLKPYHHIRLDNEFKSDCKVWLDFLSPTNINAVSNRVQQ